MAEPCTIGTDVGARRPGSCPVVALFCTLLDSRTRVEAFVTWREKFISVDFDNTANGSVYRSLGEQWVPNDCDDTLHGVHKALTDRSGKCAKPYSATELAFFVLMLRARRERKLLTTIGHTQPDKSSEHYRTVDVEPLRLELIDESV